MSGKARHEQRWLERAPGAGPQALRRALDEAAHAAQVGDETAFARQRVWNRVQMPWAGAPPPGRRYLGATLALGALAAAALLLGPRLLPAPIAERAGPPAPRPEVVPLPPPATIAITTGPAEEGRHQLARGVEVAIAPRSALVPGDETTPPEVKVGRVRFSVPRQPPGRRYAVRAGGYQVVVLGTTFDVAVDEAGVGVAVASGVVAVVDAGSGRQLSRLIAGQRWSSAAFEKAAREAPRPRRRRPAMASASLRDPVAARAYDEAGEARRRGEVELALARYRRLVEAGGPLAEVALYEIGVVESEDLADHRRAVATWERLRERFPSGLLRVETDLSIVEALARVRDDRALPEARAFLARHPESERRFEVARVAGDLLRTRGDCKSAIGFYEVAAQKRFDSVDADDALFHRAVCLAAVDGARGREAARAYLARFPLGRHAVPAQHLVEGGKVDGAGR